MLADRRNRMAAASSTRGLIAGGCVGDGSGGVNVIEYVTMTSLGDSIDFGDLTDNRRRGSGLSNSVRGIFAGGYGSPGNVNIIDYVSISTLGNALDFGDLPASNVYRLGTGSSDSHGGIGNGIRWR